jgi:hypothetical protein
MAASYSRSYRGRTQADALVQFTEDVQEAEWAGFRPVAQEWQHEGDEEVLRVAFKHVSFAPRSLDGGPLPDDERIASLRRVVRELTTRGWAIEHQSDFQAVVRSMGLSRQANLMNGCLTVVTFGVWAIFWYVLRRPRRRLIVIEEFGTIAGAIYKPGSPPKFGRTISSSGVEDLPPRQRLITINAWVVANSTVLCELEGDQIPQVRIQSIDPRVTDYEIFQIYLSANAEPGTKVAWFVLS